MRLTGNRWARFGTSIFSVMTQHANEHGAINLAQGFPDFDGPDAIKDAAIAAIRGRLNQYAPSPGLLSLRQLIADRYKRKHGLTFTAAKEVSVFSGATEAIFSAALAYCNPGDEILAFAPFYDSYPAAAFAAGVTFRTVALLAPNWGIDWLALEKTVSSRTRFLLLNTPHNPTGKVFSQDELLQISDFAIRHDLIVVTDEVYDELTYGTAIHCPLVTLPGMYDRVVTISSTAKTFSFTGWKIGYAVANAALMEPLRAVHQFSVFCSATPLQAGMIAGLELPHNYYDELRIFYQKRRDLLHGALTAAGFKCRASDGTYFLLADYSELSNANDFDFALWMTKTAKVACVPLSGFLGGPTDLKYVRFAFCKTLETLEAGIGKLAGLPGLLK